MNWLTDSFQQYSIAWILISAFVGGVIGAATKFLFEDLLRPRLGLRREARAVLRTYTTPLTRSGETLERQINNFVRNAKKDWYRGSDYYQLSTLHAFAEYLAWVRLIERKLGFVAIEHSRRGRELDEALNGFFRAMSSFRYFRWSKDEAPVERSLVPRKLFTAMGEVTIADDAGVLEFSEFCVRYVNDGQFRRWFAELDAFLAAVCDDPYRWDRLICAGANLRALIWVLRGTVVPKSQADLANLERIKHPQVRQELESDLAGKRRGKR